MYGRVRWRRCGAREREMPVVPPGAALRSSDGGKVASNGRRETSVLPADRTSMAYIFRKETTEQAATAAPGVCCSTHVFVFARFFAAFRRGLGWIVDSGDGF